jgi:hypothetical protein
MEGRLEEKGGNLSGAGKYDDPEVVASSYAELGEKDKAFFWLNKAYDEHELLFMKSSRDYDGLPGDPRYADLLRRMKLPQ